MPLHLFPVLFFIVLDSVSCRKQTRRHMVQPLDHFKNTTRTWKMRYAVRRNFWRAGGPVFIHIGGEGPMPLRYLETNRPEIELVRETHGVIFMLEHRYYGHSLLTHSLGEEEYKYLSSRQTLADIAYFIKVVKRHKHYKNSKVVAIGGSYAGNLASWLRQLYPELVDAAWASSAPVLAKLEFPEYYETLGNVFRKIGGDECYEDIWNLFKDRNNMLKSKRGINALKEKEKICAYVDLTRPIQRHVYFHRRINDFVVQDKTKVADICLKLSNSSKNVLSNTRRPLIGGRGCDLTDYNESIVDSDNRAWLYQTCSEFGFMQTTSSSKQPFGNNINLGLLIQDSCKIYGKQYNAAYIQRAVDKTNKMYGGLHPNVTKVVFVNGGLDPWHKLGILQNISADAPTIFMQNTHHCEDLEKVHQSESHELKVGKYSIKQLIKKWILT